MSTEHEQELERLKNITVIQQKQIDRLIDERDAPGGKLHLAQQELERVKKELAEAKLPTVEQIQDIYSIYRERDRAEKAEKERDEALAREGELRHALKEIKVRIAYIGMPQEPMWEIDPGRVQPDWRKWCQLLEHALHSPDCGKGFRSPEEYAALEAKLEELSETYQDLWARYTKLLTNSIPVGEHAELQAKYKWAVGSVIRKGFIPVEELITWLKSEILDDEGAMINARDHGEWDRYHRLEGHKDGLLHAVHHLRAHLESLRKAAR